MLLESVREGRGTLDLGICRFSGTAYSTSSVALRSGQGAGLGPSEKMSKHKPPWTAPVTLGRGWVPMSSSRGPWAADFADGRVLGSGT